MSEVEKISLLGLAYELGKLCDIQDLSELRSDDKVLETLLKLGLEKYSKSNLSGVEMAYNSAQRTIKESSVEKSEIDVLLYATDRDSGLNNREDASHIISKLELKCAYPIGISFSGSGNLHTALRIATSFVKAGECKNVLIITTSKFEEGSSRLIPPNISIQSDAAASCIVSSTVKGEFEIVKTIQHSDARMIDIDPVNQLTKYFEYVAKGIEKTISELMSSLKKVPEDFCKLITNNYNLSVNGTIRTLSGFSEEQSFTENISRFAHAVAADNLINLSDLSNNNLIQKDGLALLLGTGPNTWGATALLKT
ncbi:hypothetical protein NUACC21_52940 [Scytonema sp. NUACC21]